MEDNKSSKGPKFNSTCSAAAKALVECVAETYCFKNGRTLKHCTENDYVTMEKCKGQLEAFKVCKSSQIKHE